MRNFSRSALATALFSFSALSQAAGTDSTSINIKLVIQESCSIDTGTPSEVDFGSHVRSNEQTSAVGGLKVNCSQGTPYTIALGTGNNANAGVRRLKHASSDEFVAYGLFSDAAYSTAWGEGTTALSGTGTGSDVNVPVYGRVTSLNAPAGAYADVVTATISY